MQGLANFGNLFFFMSFILLKTSFAATVPMEQQQPTIAETVSDAKIAAEHPDTADSYRRGYFKGTVGLGASFGSAYSSNTFGGGAGLSLGGFVARRWSLGVFYKGAVSATPDFGLLGGGYFASTIYGVETDFSLVKGRSNEFRLGARAGQIRVGGVSSVFFIPVAVNDIKTWGFGTSLSFFHFVSKYFGLGAELSYFYALKGSTAADSLAGTRNSDTQGFGIFDVAFAIQARAF